MSQIDSPQNQHVKLFRSLLRKKGRYDAGLCPLEGVRLISGALRADADLEAVYVCEDLLSDERALEMAAALEETGVRRHDLTTRAFESMVDTETPQGLAATAHIDFAELDDLHPDPHSAYLFLHDIRDPGNMGTLIRTAGAFECGAIVTLGSCVDPYNPKVLRATAGGVFALPLIDAPWSKAREWTVEHDISTIASSLEADIPCDQADFGQSAALLVGSEAHGLPAEILTDTDVQVTIPMSADVESLNVGIAAGILLYEIYTQIHA